MDASGWFTFGLNSGNRRVWLNASRADDSGDGLSAATAKKTWDAAWAVLKAGNPGDQLMVAQGGTYTDSGDATGSNSWTFFGYGTTTLAFTYPTAVLSYDPADAANGAKYGRATGSNMPILNIPTNGNTPSLTVFGNSGTHGYAIQGMEFAGHYGIGFNGPHTMVIQNTRWNVATLSINVNASSPTPVVVGVNVSKASFWGAWATNGNNSALFVTGIDTPYLQDLAFAHSGWEVGASRSDPTSSGGANGFGHSLYYYPNNINGHLDRIVFVDSAADGLNIRGGGHATQIVSLDEPITSAFGGSSSGDYSNEAPNGRLIQADDWLVMGGANINGTTPFGMGFSAKNTIAGSYIRNVAMIDNPNYGLSNNTYLGGGNDNPNITQALLLDKIHGYNYSPSLTSGFITTNPVAVTWTNCIIDAAISGTGMIDGGGNSVSNGSTFPNYKTRDQVITALLNGSSIAPGADYAARKAQLVNAMLWRPDLPWAQALIAIGLPAMNLTPLYPTASPPDMTGEVARGVYA